MQRPSRPTPKEKNLVADQPGFAIFTTGILFSLLVGFSIRGVIHPSKVQHLVAEAASKIHKEVNVRFETAELSLANGPWPRIAVVIRNIQMQSANPCWFRPSLDIDEIELPLDMWAFLKAGNPITTIQAHRARLRLESDKQDCNRVQLEANQAPAKPPSRGVVLLVDRAESKSAVSPSLDRVLIQYLEIDPVQFPLAHSELRGVELSVKSHQPRIITLRAQSDILKDPNWGEYSAHAQISVEFSEFPEKNLEIHVSGNWLEGSYSWHTSYRLDDGFYSTEAELRHIPLAKIRLLTQSWGLERLEPLKQVWVSSKLKSQGLSSRWKKSPLEVRDFKIEGDSGDLWVDKVEWSHLEDPSPQPFLAQMRSLSLETLLHMGLQEHPSPIIRKLGLFTGRAEVENLLNLRLLGELEGLQFVFANRGQREFQSIRRLSLDLQRAQGRWKLDVSRLEPDQGVFNGELTASADKDIQEVKGHFFADELSLSPAVQKLMSGGGSLGTFQSRIDFGFKKGILNRLQGRLQGQDLDIENFKIPKFSLNIQNEGADSFLATLNIPESLVGLKMVDSNLLKPLKELLPKTEMGYEIKNLRSTFSLKDFNSIKWKSFNFSFNKGTFQGQGQWNPEGELQGQILLRNSQGAYKFNLEGHRDNPTLNLVK